MRVMSQTGCAVAALLLSMLGAPGDTFAARQSSGEQWVALFNGHDLDGWTPKVAGHALGDNVGDTFRVEDGLLKVRYDEYQTFDGQFAHLFYKTPYSYYRLVVEYRIVGDKVPDSPEWTQRNSGVMLHAQDPRSMSRSQDFPISIEAQLLSSLGDGKPRPTMNLCTPGTEVVVNGRVYPKHCLESSSDTFDHGQWVRAEVLVLGNGPITHFVDGKKVLEYAMPQIGGGVVSGFDPATKQDGKLLDTGYIALQGESHPVDFRTIELLDLSGCMDRAARNYRAYFVKSVPERCIYAGSSRSTQPSP